MIYWPLLNMYKSRYYNRLKNYLSYCGTAVCNADYNNAIRLQNKNNSSTSTLTTTLLMRVTFRYTCLPFAEEYCCRDHTTDKCEFTFETLSACNSDFCLNLFACFTVKWQKQRYTQPPLSPYPTLPYPSNEGNEWQGDWIPKRKPLHSISRQSRVKPLVHVCK